MKIYEIGTGYTSIPADKGAATEIVVENLSHALIEFGHDVAVIDIEDSNRLSTDLPIVEVSMPNGFGATDEALGIRHKLKRVVYSIRLASVLKRILKETPDNERIILHFHNQYNAFFFYKLVSPSLRKRARVVYTVHSYIWHDCWDKIKDIIPRRYFQEIYAMKHADCSFVLNSDSAQTIVDNIGIDSNRIILIANGVDTNTYQPIVTNEVQEIRTKLGIDDKRCIIQVGSVCDRKNQLGAIEMLLPLLKARQDIAYLYAGGIIDEEYARLIEKFACEQGIENRVIYLGELKPGKELNKYYNLADCCVFSTKAEAFSLVVLEAMSSGLPVFVDRGLKIDLDGCLRYESGEDLCLKIRSLLDDAERRSCQSRLARNTVLNGFSWKKVAIDYLNAFNELI